MTQDEQTLYFFAFRYALPRQSYALSLVSDLVLRRVNDFDDWQLRDMIGEIEAYWEWNKDIHPIDRDVQRLFRDRLQVALLERGVAQLVRVDILAAATK
jgi:single-stranded DNA-binding protein